MRGVWRAGASNQTRLIQETLMEMKPVNSGKLRAIGFDARTRTLQVKLDDGSMLQYSGVGEEVFRRLGTSGAAWSFYRDNIEEEFGAKRVSGNASTSKIDDLFLK
jgi:KTSC domain